MPPQGGVCLWLRLSRAKFGDSNGGLVITCVGMSADGATIRGGRVVVLAAEFELRNVVFDGLTQGVNDGRVPVLDSYLYVDLNDLIIT